MQSISNRSPIIFSYTSFGLEKVYWRFVSVAVIRFFEILKMFYCSDGWTEYQKCPSNFFILCGYKEHVYTYLYVYSKIVSNILIGFEISRQVGGRGKKFQNYRR